MVYSYFLFNGVLAMSSVITPFIQKSDILVSGLEPVCVDRPCRLQSSFLKYVLYIIIAVV